MQAASRKAKKAGDRWVPFSMKCQRFLPKRIIQMKPGTLASAIVIVALMAWCGTLRAQESSGDLQQLRSRLRQLESHLQQVESELHQLEDDLPEGEVKPNGEVPKSDVSQSDLPKSDVQPVGAAQPAGA